MAKPAGRCRRCARGACSVRAAARWRSETHRPIRFAESEIHRAGRRRALGESRDRPELAGVLSEFRTWPAMREVCTSSRPKSISRASAPRPTVTGRASFTFGAGVERRCVTDRLRSSGGGGGAPRPPGKPAPRPNPGAPPPRPPNGAKFRTLALMKYSPGLRPGSVVAPEIVGLRRPRGDELTRALCVVVTHRSHHRARRRLARFIEQVTGHGAAARQPHLDARALLAVEQLERRARLERPPLSVPEMVT